jgi:hypothetical protein
MQMAAGSGPEKHTAFINFVQTPTSMRYGIAIVLCLLLLHTYPKK